MKEHELLAGEYRVSLRGPVNVDYVGRTTAQEMATPDDGRRLVFWAPETLVKLALPREIEPGRLWVRSLNHVIDPASGRVVGAGVAVVMRREGLDQEVYAHLLSGVLDLVSVVPLSGQATCKIQNTEGEKIELTLCFREISDVA